jgi:hypothetical protein
VIHPVGIVFKGSGFYATDSRGKGVSSSTKPAAESGTDAKTGEGKPAADGKPADGKKTEAPAKPSSSTESKTSAT